MSYNTRRQSGQGMGVGRGTSQVLYHQTSPRSGVPRMSQSPSSGYSSQQNIQTVNSAYGSQSNAPAYSTQSVPPPSAPSSQGGYSSQSQVEKNVAHSMQANPRIKFQSQQPPPPQPPQPQPVKVERPQTPTPPAPAAVQPQPTPAAPPAMEVDPDSAGDASSEVKPKPWMKKKVPGFKVNKRVKRRRQNARLRKILQPKNAIMVLNELKTGIKFSFQEHTNALTQTMFVVNAEVDGKTYIGQGLSKPLAKQNAAENALKALLLEKMAEAALKASDSSSDGTETMQQDVNNGVATNPAPNTTADSVEGSDIGSEGSKGNAPEDDVPWGSLASFALYKLFTEWQSQGTHVPLPQQQAPIVPPNQPVKPGAPAPMKKIPDNPTERHPVMLLNQLKPGVQFTEISREGTTPNLTFTLGVTVDGKSYMGVAKNKKDAKKEAAKSALAGVFNIFYE